MFTETITKLRDGLAAKRFTMKQLADASGVPIATIADMKKPNWQKRTLDNVNAIAGALEVVDSSAGDASQDVAA